MLRNYFKTTLRNIRRNKLFTGLNIASLATGLASALLIFLWVTDELSYDRFTPNAEKIFRLTAEVKTTPSAAVPAAFGRIGNSIPAIKRLTRIAADQKIITADNRKFNEKQIGLVDNNFLRLFNYPLLRGNPATALNRPNSIILTEATAVKYFGGIDQAMGKPVFIDDDSLTAQVTGILKDMPSNSHLHFDLLMPIVDMDAQTDPSHGWRFFDSYVYYELADPADMTPPVISAIEGQLNAMRANAIAGTPAVQAVFSLQPLTDIHLRSRFTIDVAGMGNIQYVRIFMLIAIFIVIIACINFMNLATAVSGTRVKEVALRKTIGALRWQLIGQFIGESMLLAFLSLILALVLVYIALPFFNTLAAKSIRLDLLDARLIAEILAITAFVGLLAGSYPAFYLSSIRTIRVLKGSALHASRKAFLRNGLVILQFTVSVILMIGTVVVRRQLHFLHDRDIGFDRNNLLYVPLPALGNRQDNSQALRTTLSQTAATADFTIVGDLPANIEGTRPLTWSGMDKNNPVLCRYLNVDGNTLTTFGMKMAAGRFYPPGSVGNDSIYDYVINETTARIIRREPATAVGTKISVRGREGTVIGVVRDFNFRPVHQAIEPLVMRAIPAGNYAVVRSTADHFRETLASVQTAFHQVYGDTPFSYGLIDQDLDRLYIAETRLGSLFNVFSILSIFISCLGLFGLATFTAQRRTKEIGVRKVLGAAESHIVLLLAKEFLQLVALSLLLAFPLAWYLMNRWLESFVDRTDISIGIFVDSGLLALLIAIFPVSYTTIRAALDNPINALRTE